MVPSAARSGVVLRESVLMSNTDSGDPGGLGRLAAGAHSSDSLRGASSSDDPL
jgi:hypothetical protein